MYQDTNPRNFRREQYDPNGTDAHAPGAKLDGGKLRPGLVLGGFARALTDVTAVGTYGAAKYSDNGWRSVPNARQRYTDAFWRHLLASQYETLDPESGLPHTAHAAWNLLALLEFDYILEDIQ